MQKSGVGARFQPFRKIRDDFAVDLEGYIVVIRSRAVISLTIRKAKLIISKSMAKTLTRTVEKTVLGRAAFREIQLDTNGSNTNKKIKGCQAF